MSLCAVQYHTEKGGWNWGNSRNEPFLSERYVTTLSNIELKYKCRQMNAKDRDRVRKKSATAIVWQFILSIDLTLCGEHAVIYTHTHTLSHWFSCTCHILGDDNEYEETWINAGLCCFFSVRLYQNSCRTLENSLQKPILYMCVYTRECNDKG